MRDMRKLYTDSFEQFLCDGYSVLQDALSETFCARLRVNCIDRIDTGTLFVNPDDILHRALIPHGVIVLHNFGIKHATYVSGVIVKSEQMQAGTNNAKVGILFCLDYGLLQVERSQPGGITCPVKTMVDTPFGSAVVLDSRTLYTFAAVEKNRHIAVMLRYSL